MKLLKLKTMMHMKFSSLTSLYAALDAWLWRQGISQPGIRALLRHEIAATLLALLAGLGLMAITSWLFWFGAGIGVMCWIFWSWARFFSRMSGGIQPGVLPGALGRWLLRMLVFALALCLGLRVGASALALAAGVAFGAAVGLVSLVACDRSAHA